MTPDKAFSSFPWQSGKIATLDRAYPSYLSAAIHAEPLTLCTSDTHFGYVEPDPASPRIYADAPHMLLVRPGKPDRVLYPGDAFSHNGYGRLIGSGTRAVVISREGWNGLPYITAVEHEGRLRYIDGCTDSLLIPPVKLGDPCLNLLYFPAGIDQTAHTHPSDRIGLILSGHGLCHAWDAWGHEERIELLPGMLFCIHTDGRHKFSTPYGEDMRVLAYHPESDFGPEDENHPMLNRTIVDGVSASKIPAIQTR